MIKKSIDNRFAVVFCVTDCSNLCPNTVTKRIYYFIHNKGIKFCFIYDRDSNIAIAEVDPNSEYGIKYSRHAVIDDNILVKEVVVLDLVSGNLFVDKMGFESLSFLVMFDSVYDDMCSLINAIIKKINIFYPQLGIDYISLKHSHLGYIDLLWKFKCYGFYQYIGLIWRFLYKGIKVYIISDYKSICKFSIKKFDIKLISDDCKNYYDKPISLMQIDKIGLVLGWSPTHTDCAPTEIDRILTLEYVSRLSRLIKTFDKEVVILGHPRDLYFAENLAKETGCVICMTNRPRFSEYISFPSSVVSAIIGISPVTIISYDPYLEDYAGRYWDIVMGQYLLAKNISKRYNTKIYCF